MEAMGSCVLSGSLPIHDLERAHGALVRGGRLESEAHRADVNDLCSWLKRYL